MMTLSADRASGAFFLLFGLALYFLVIPAQVETAEGGNLAPDTMPNLIALVIALCGGLLVVKPTDHEIHDMVTFAITGAYALVLALGFYAMSWFGFEIVAPPLAFAIMWMIGERRPLWLVGGAGVMPLVIWFLVTVALGRGLP